MSDQEGAANYPAPARPAVHNPYAKSSRPPSSPVNPMVPSIGNSAASVATSMPKLRPTSFSQAFGDDAFETTTTSTVSAPTNTNHEDVTNPDHLIRDHRDYHKALQPHVLGVSPRQQGNGLLKYIRNVPTQLCQMVPDYIMNGTSCALFLSIKYHQLYPAYIHKRLGELGRAFKVRVLLVFVDVDDCANSLLQLNKLGVTQSLTVILAWSEQEAARYLETFKALDGKDATSIQKRASNNVVDQMADVLTTCKPMNKTDAATVWQHFGNLKGIAQASQDELALCPGLGKVKTQRLYAALHKPFSKRATRERQKKKEEEEEAEKARMEKQNQAAKGNNDENENGSGAGRGEILIS